MKFGKIKRLFGIVVILFLMGLGHPSDGWTDYTILHTFIKDFDNDGANPLGSPTLVGSTLYGTTRGGSPACGYTSGCGVMFRINTDGSDYAILSNRRAHPDEQEQVHDLLEGYRQSGNNR